MAAIRGSTVEKYEKFGGFVKRHVKSSKIILFKAVLNELWVSRPFDHNQQESDNMTLREKCLDTEFFFVRIFSHSEWIQRDTSCLSVFSLNTEKYTQEKTIYLDTFHAVWTLSICDAYFRKEQSLTISAHSFNKLKS